MAIDFTLPADVVEIRDRVRRFMDEDVRPVESNLRERADPRADIQLLRDKAKREKLWNPHLPAEFGGLGLGPMAMATVSAECGRTRWGAYVLNCMAPDEGNMHTLLHNATPAQKEKYLRPLAEGKIRSCFAMTEPEVAGSDPTQIRTSAVKHGDQWVINGHKWFTSGANGAAFAIVIARTRYFTDGSHAGDMLSPSTPSPRSSRSASSCSTTCTRPPRAVRQLGSG